MKNSVKNSVAKTKVSMKLDMSTLLSTASPFDNIETVDSFEGLELYKAYKTVNYDLIKSNPLNRVDPKRIKNFEKLIKNGDYFEKSIVVLVDHETKQQNDHHHKVRAMANCGLPITFMLCDLGTEFRGKLSFENIAKLNDSNSAWTPKNKYDQACKHGSHVAVFLKSMKARLDEVESTNNFRPWNILNFALGRNCESGISIEDYRNEEYLTSLIEFEKNEFDSLVDIIGKLLMFPTLRPSDILKRISILNGLGEINVNIFAHKFAKHFKSFQPINKNKAVVDAEIKRIYNMKG